MIARTLVLGSLVVTGIVVTGLSDERPVARATAPPISDDDREYFEARVRPVLIEHCYECHNSHEVAEGGLAVDHRDGLLAGGDSGPAIVPGEPASSRLLQVVRHEIEGQEMPMEAPRLSAEVIMDLERWIDRGAPDPRDSPPSAEDVAAATSWGADFERRRRDWLWQPVQTVEPPAVDHRAWSRHPVDQFLYRRMEEQELRPSDEADRRVLLLRLHAVLTGLPPTPEEMASFLADRRPDAYERRVRALLDTPSFGERWARHWMDWLRYAESHGSEGDPAIPRAWEYRDYLIRSLNQDVSYFQLVREHLAGDLLEPRLSEDGLWNEAAIGTAHFRMVQHGFQPTDALDELVRFTDDQVNVVTKAFQGITVSCARCHNHKFDAISQADYYAWFGIFAESLPATVAFDARDRLTIHDDALLDLKSKLRTTLAERWLEDAEGIRERLEGVSRDAEDDPRHVLYPLVYLRQTGNDERKAAWSALWDSHHSENPVSTGEADGTPGSQWDLADDFENWVTHGTASWVQGLSPGSFTVSGNDNRILRTIHPAGVYSHLLTEKASGTLASPRFRIQSEAVSVLVMGRDFGQARLAIQNYPIPRGGIYAMKVQPIHEELRWVTWDTRYWIGDEAFVEAAPFDDLTFFAQQGNGGQSPDRGDGRSAIGIRAVRFHDLDDRPAPPAPSWTALGEDGPPADMPLEAWYAATLRRCIERWRDDDLTDGEAAFLNAALQHGLLVNAPGAAPEAAALAAEYRALEAEIPVARRAPGILPGPERVQPLYVRGDPEQPGETVPPRFLEALDPTPFSGIAPARLQLSETIASPDNPLTSRVAVNRIWHHVFGRGIVASPDNFGRMGEPPTHPQLLDYLAARFVAEDGSIKQMVEFLVTSRAFRQASVPSAAAAERDPNNRFLSHMRVRRLDAEAIRDKLLAVSGRLDTTMYGPPVQGGIPRPRRSVYVRVYRNALDPFLRVFDFPEPFSCTGRRSVTNVPAQSLTLMNDPLVEDLASDLARRLLSEIPDADTRLVRLYERALGRPHTPAEAAQVNLYLQALQQRAIEAEQALAASGQLLEERRESVERLLEPYRRQLSRERGEETAVPDGPQPLAHWTFDEDLRDVEGNLDGRAHGNARVVDGMLVLDGQSYVSAAPLPRDVHARSLEAWVMLDDLDQRGGGIMTIQSDGGRVFDAIVFGEQAPRHWLAGSDFFNRTESFQGSPEHEAHEQPVHLVLTWDEDGTIAAYRNGQAYGRPYQAGDTARYSATSSAVLFGLRHEPPGGNRFLKGRVLEARLYDRALADADVQSLWEGGPRPVTTANLLALMPETEKQRYEMLTAEIAGLAAAREEWTPALELRDPTRRWKDLVLAVFNLKEFIYIP